MILFLSSLLITLLSVAVFILFLQFRKLERTATQYLTQLDSGFKALDKSSQKDSLLIRQTLEQRLGESFKRVDERLEQVHRGLGEMQAVANGVDDLKRLLNNIKTRGTWAEVQLGALLQEILAPNQFEANVKIRPRANELVDFAIKLPGQSSELEPLWLPIDAKFPLEDYLRLIEARDLGDVTLSEKAAKQLEQRIKLEARSIRDKYIHPPHTTDFAILFLPIEGLYIEVIRRNDLIESLQRDCRVIIAGPSVLMALLNSLQLGFKTLAIQRKTSEAWGLLSGLHKDMATFLALVEKADKKIHEANSSLYELKEKASRINTKLQNFDLLQHELRGSELPEASSHLS